MNNDLINREALLLDLSQDREDGTFEFSEEQAEAADKIVRYVYSRIIAQPAGPGLPRVLTLEEVMAQERGTVLWVEEAQNYVWNLFPLEVDLISTHPDTGTYYLFFIAYHGLKKYEGDEYGTAWRCWSARPTDEQRKAAPWSC